MMTRGGRAERQALLRMLKSVRLETEEKRKQLEQKHAAIPPMSPAQAEEVIARVLATSDDALVELFQDYPLRAAGKNPFYYTYGDPRDTPHSEDPELAAAVEALNLALDAYDHATLDLRVAEFLGGRVLQTKPRTSSQRSTGPCSALIELQMFALLVSATKTISFYESLRGGNLRDLERENFEQLWLHRARARAKRKAEEQSRQ